VFVANDVDGLIAALRDHVDRGGRGTVFAGTARRPEDQLLGLFDRPGELRDLVAGWVERGQWDRIAPLWVNGVDIDWRAHHGARPPVRVSLPTYPFAGERYWPAAGAVPVAPTVPDLPGTVPAPRGP
ncbi:hypothetical protein GTY62_26275, partial [Streptomyces sp. SID724]|nr:hypothetical protein [Streptomyces sp. SID724]